MDSQHAFLSLVDNGDEREIESRFAKETKNGRGLHYLLMDYYYFERGLKTNYHLHHHNTSYY